MAHVLIFLLYSLPVIHLQAVYCCDIYRFVESNDQAFEGHVITSITKTFVNLCWGDCVYFPWCFSINARQTIEGTFECELNNSSKKANPQKMKRRKGWSYHEMTNIGPPGCSIYDCRRKEDLGDDWRRYGNVAIKLFTEKKNWADARSYCQSLGGDLLSINRSHENEFVNEIYVKPLNFSLFRQDYPETGAPYMIWRLNQPEPTVLLKGAPGDVLYKAVDGETALHFTGRNGYAHIPVVNVNPEGFTISFWMKMLRRNYTGKWIDALSLLYKALSIKNPAYMAQFYYKSGQDPLSLKVGSGYRYINCEYNSWTHFCVSGNMSSGFWLYVMNGKEKMGWIPKDCPPVTGKENFLLGVKRQLELDSGNTLYGFLRDLMVINDTLDFDQIQTFAFWNEQGAWIGLNDQANTGHLSWSDGTPIGQFMPFHRDTPNPALSERKCVIIGNDGKWFDKICNMKNPFICMKSLND